MNKIHELVFLTGIFDLVGHIFWQKFLMYIRTNSYTLEIDTDKQDYEFLITGNEKKKDMFLAKVQWNLMYSSGQFHLKRILFRFNMNT